MSVSVSIENLQECVVFFSAQCSRKTPPPPFLPFPEWHHCSRGRKSIMESQESELPSGHHTETGFGEDAGEGGGTLGMVAVGRGILFSQPYPLLQKGPWAQHLQCWLEYTASPPETGVVRVNMVGASVWNSNKYLLESCGYPLANWPGRNPFQLGRDGKNQITKSAHGISIRMVTIALHVFHSTWTGELGRHTYTHVFTAICFCLQQLGCILTT